MGNEQIHGKIGRKKFTEFFYIHFAFETCECITYSKYNNEKGKQKLTIKDYQTFK